MAELGNGLNFAKDFHVLIIKFIKSSSPELNGY